MARFNVRIGSGEDLTVEASNWMMAIGRALTILASDQPEMVQWVCTPQEDGGVSVHDPVTGTQIAVRRLERADVPEVRAIVPPELPGEPEDRPRERTEDRPLAAGTSGPLQMPRGSSLEDPPFPGRQVTPLGRHLRDATTYDLDELVLTEEVPLLAERLFELSSSLVGVPQEEACRRALQILMEVLPAEASSVALAGVNDVELQIIAATGPVAERVVGTRVPFGKGLLGLCFDTGIPIQVDDVRGDARHDPGVDARTGFSTQAVLCVPIVNEQGFHGVIELINPRGPSDAPEVDVARQVALTLANAVGPELDS